MGRRRKRFLRLRLNQKSTRSITALILLLLAFLTAFAYLSFAVDQPFILQDFLNRLFGRGVILIPVLLFLAGLSLTQIKWEIAQPRVLFGASLFFLSLLGLIHLFIETEVAREVALRGDGGGLVGFTLSRTLADILSTFGAFLVFISAILIAFLMIFNASLDEVGLWIAGVVKPASLFVQTRILGRTLEYIKNRRQETGDRAQEESKIGREKIDQKRKAEIKITGIAEPELEVVSEGEGAMEEPSRIEASEVSGVTAAKAGIPYELPPLSILSDPEQVAADRGDIEKNAHIIEKTLDSFGIQARVSEVNLGPSVTQYALSLTEGTKISKVTALHNDLALTLAAPTGAVRIEAPIPGKSLVGVEVPNYSPTLVTLKSILTSETMTASEDKLAVSLGHNVAGEPVVASIARWPHILISGSTGSGKSVLLHAFLATILFRATPEEVKFILVDPKRVELTQFAGIPHLLMDVLVESERVVPALKWAVAEMEKRYRLFQEVRARNIADFNKVTEGERIPYIIIMVDELADLMAFAAVEVENLICRIAQMSRATGIHLVLSTQRPSVDVLTGLIKANIPARIALNVSSGTDSRVIIDTTGAEKLIGRGDMLYLPPDAAKPIRIQGVYVTEEEIKKLVVHLRQFGQEPSTEEEIFVGVKRGVLGDKMVTPEPEDSLFGEALTVISNHQRASASLLQRRLRVGYARAARLLDELEEREMVGPKNGSHPREVNFPKVQGYLQQKEHP